jgi:hypothetical protein
MAAEEDHGCDFQTNLCGTRARISFAIRAVQQASSTPRLLPGARRFVIPRTRLRAGV